MQRGARRTGRVGSRCPHDASFASGGRKRSRRGLPRRGVERGRLAGPSSGAPPPRPLVAGRPVRSRGAGLDASFFPSVGFGRVAGIFAALGYRPDVARDLAGLTTNATPLAVLRGRPMPSSPTPAQLSDRFYADRWLATPHLPRGAPTSPALANLVLRPGSAAGGVGCGLSGHGEPVRGRHHVFGSLLASLGRTGSAGPAARNRPGRGLRVSTIEDSRDDAVGSSAGAGPGGELASWALARLAGRARSHAHQLRTHWASRPEPRRSPGFERNCWADWPGCLLPRRTRWSVSGRSSTRSRGRDGTCCRGEPASCCSEALITALSRFARAATRCAERGRGWYGCRRGDGPSGWSP